MNKKIKMKKQILSENDLLAAGLRDLLLDNRVFCINLVSSPGSGKTSLLENTLSSLGKEIGIAVIVGDVQTDNDAVRLLRTGAPVVRPVTTGGACHLDARMVERAMQSLDLSRIDLLCIENVGNLVCPAGFDLGEDMKVVLMSTAEGDDKPLKYPAMFRRSGLLVINKIDLLGYSDFDVASARDNARRIHPQIEILELSCRSGEGLDTWYGWLRQQLTRKKGAR
jgi:hydrogenase nickel incorporation protein HypB